MTRFALLLPIFVVFASGAKLKFSKTEQDAILDVHNKLRSTIALGRYVAKGVKQPSAANMNKLVWSPEITRTAQLAADKCQLKHSKTPGVGENIWILNGKNLTNIGTRASKCWESEFQKHGIRSLFFSRSVFNSGIGHAAQMAWAETDKIGCSMCLHKNSKVLVICQYSTQGNMLYTNIYKPGTTCSKCGNGLKCEKKSGLCVRK